MKIHACWLDKECKSHGVPAMTYITALGWTIRINPFYDKTMKFFDINPWTWRILQIIKRPERS